MFRALTGITASLFVVFAGVFAAQGQESVASVADVLNACPDGGEATCSPAALSFSLNNDQAEIGNLIITLAETGSAPEVIYVDCRSYAGAVLVAANAITDTAQQAEMRDIAARMCEDDFQTASFRPPASPN